MKLLALVLIFGLNCAAHAGYTEAAAALKGVDGKMSNDLDGYLAQPGEVLARSEKATALLADNQQALDLFRQAAAAASDGYLLAPKTDKPTSNTPAPQYGPHFKLLKLALLDAKVKAARGQRAQAEADLLAAAGLLEHFAAQKSFMVLSSMMWQLCLQKSFPVFAETLRDPKSGGAYLGALAAKLGGAAAAQDFMAGAVSEEIEMEKNTVAENVTVEKLALDRAKLSWWQRFVLGRFQDEEYAVMARAKYGAAADARAKALAEAFRANTPALFEDFVGKQLAEAKARRDAYAEQGALVRLKAAFGGAKEPLADFLADTLTGTASPAYGKLVPRYHSGLNQLAVLRAALAVKLYTRAKRRLPDGLEQLAPEFLAAVPQDTFNGNAPLSYLKEKKKFKLYSFGPDGKDDKAALELDFKTYFDNPAMNAGDIIYAD